MHNICQSVRFLDVELENFFENKINEVMLLNLSKAVKDAVDIREAGFEFRELPFNKLSRNGIARYDLEIMAVGLNMNKGEFDEFSSGKMEIGVLEKDYVKELD